MKCSWREGNKIQLLENGEQYYPAVFKAIGEAQERIILETFIWFEDDVGKQLHAALLAAAQRGVKAEVLLDGYGSPDLSDEFVNELTAAGVVFRYYDPRPRLFGMRTNVFRRMHRKIVVIDARIAFIGGLNYSAEHMSSYGPEAKQDYAVRLEGPIVEDILQFELENLPGQSLSLDQILIPCAIRSLAARKPSSLLCRASQPSQRAPQLAIPVRLLSIKPPSLAIAM